MFPFDWIMKNLKLEPRQKNEETRISDSGH